MKNLDGGFYVKTSFRFVFCLKETLNGKQNNSIWDALTRGFLIEIQLRRYNVGSTQRNLWFFIHFYYLQVIRIFSRNVYCLFSNFFHDYDLTTRNYLSNHISKAYKAPSQSVAK